MGTIETTIVEMKNKVIEALDKKHNMSVAQFAQSSQAVELFGADKVKHIPIYLSLGKATSVSFPFLQKMYDYLKLGKVLKKEKREVSVKYYISTPVKKKLL